MKKQVDASSYTTSRDTTGILFRRLAHDAPTYSGAGASGKLNAVQGRIGSGSRAVDPKKPNLKRPAQNLNRGIPFPLTV